MMVPGFQQPKGRKIEDVLMSRLPGPGAVSHGPGSGAPPMAPVVPGQVSSHGPGSGASPMIPQPPRSVTPPGRPNLPPPTMRPQPGFVDSGHGGDPRLPGGRPQAVGGFDPRTFGARLSPEQRADFAALTRNMGGDFTNIGGEQGLMRRYGIRPMSGPISPGGPRNVPLNRAQSHAGLQDLLLQRARAGGQF